MKESLEKMPQLDSIDPNITAQVIALRAKVQKQGDPLLVLRLDEILFLKTTQEKVTEFKNIMNGIQWRD